MPSCKGIKEFDKRHIFTAHCHPENSALDQYAQEGWVDLNTTYTYNIVHGMLLKDYQRTPPTPFVLIESTYEGEHNASAVQIRRQAYWAILSGATGQFMGNRPIWLFDPGWEAALNYAGSQRHDPAQRSCLLRGLGINWFPMTSTRSSLMDLVNLEDSITWLLRGPQMGQPSLPTCPPAVRSPWI